MLARCGPGWAWVPLAAGRVAGPLVVGPCVVGPLVVGPCVAAPTGALPFAALGAVTDFGTVAGLAGALAGFAGGDAFDPADAFMQPKVTARITWTKFASRIALCIGLCSLSNDWSTCY